MNIFVLTAALVEGYLLFACIRSIIKQERSFGLSLYLPLILILNAVLWQFLYNYFEFSRAFFLYAGFSSCVIVMAWTDLLCCIVDDRVVIAGTVYCLCFLAWSHELVSALVGGLTGLLVSGSIYWFGNWYFSRKSCANDEDVSPGGTALCFPFVPSLALALVINVLLPGGLVSVLLHCLDYIQSHALLKYSIVLCCVALLLWIHCKRTSLEGSDADEAAYGSGDITASILLGVVLGAQNFIAVLLAGQVIHVLLSPLYRYIYYKKEACSVESGTNIKRGM